MNLPKRARRKDPLTGRYYPHTVPMSAIRRYAQAITQKFDVEKVILFGSYAYGSPTADSDVDILVVMPASNEISKANRIGHAVEPGFALDLIVRTPENLRWRLEEGDWFLRDIVGKGKVLYDKANRRMGPQGRGRLPGGHRPRRNGAEA
jgi:predicted nucleotidyltransferase